MAAAHASSSSSSSSSSPSSPTELRIPVPWGHIAGVDYPPAAGGGADAAAKTVVALHGWLDNAGSFAALAARRAAHGAGNVRLICLDFPGHGRSSPRPAGVFYSFLDYVFDLHLCLETLGLQQVSLMGHSMGAGVATIFAGTFPTRVEALALVEGIVPWLALPNHNAAENLARAVLGQEKILGKLEQPPRYEPDLTAARERLLTANSDLTAAAADTLLERGTQQATAPGAPPGAVEFTRDLRHHVAAPWRVSSEVVQDFTRRVACDVAVVLAEDGLRPPKSMDLEFHVGVLRSSAPSFALHMLPTGGHHVHMVDPDPVAALVWPFLAQPHTIRPAPASEPATPSKL